MHNISYLRTFLTISLTLALGCGDDGGGSTTTANTTLTGSSGEVLTGSTGDASTTATTTTAVPTTGGETTGGETTGAGETAHGDETTGATEVTTATTGGVELLNGCDPATAEDHTADAETVVTQTGLAYGPKCIRINAGASVKFVASFAAHPLVGGEVTGGAKVPDPASPITMTNVGMEATFAFPEGGAFGYYCDIHALSGMSGAIFVE